MPKRPGVSLTARAFAILSACAVVLTAAPAKSTDPAITRTRLSNGLRVVIAPEPVNPSPLVSVTVGYRVGHGDDPPGREGLAHLVEHMMFNGADGVADGEHTALVAEAGGYSTGGTDYRYSPYNSTVPSNQLELVLFLEAARMRDLRMTQAVLENQKKAVEAENLPDRDREVASPIVAGVVAAPRPLNIDSVTLAEAQAFYDRFYGPNNAVIVVSGDVDTLRASRLIIRYFAKIPAIQLPHRSSGVIAPVEARHFVPHPTRRALFLAYPVPTIGSREDEALGAFAAIAAGPDARLRKRLVGGGFASDVGVSVRDAGPHRWVVVNVTPVSGRSVAELEAFVRKEVAALVEDVPSPDVLESHRNSALLRHAQYLVNPEGRAELFVKAELLGTGPSDVVQRPAAIRRLSATTLQSIARKYLQSPRLIITMDKPSGQREGRW